MQTLFQDLRFGFRLLIKRPMVTAAAILALALGIGATTSIFSLADALLLKPLPYIDSTRVVVLENVRHGEDNDWMGVAPANFLDWQQQATSFGGIAASGFNDLNITGSGDPERISGASVTANFFEVVGVKPAMGRDFLPEEDQPGNNHTAILSYGLWQRRFGSDPAIAGKTVQMDGNTYTIAGVMPKNFDFPMATEIWVPMGMDAKQKLSRSDRSLRVVGRLTQGRPLGEARAQMNALAERQQIAYPDTNKGYDVKVVPIREFVSGNLTEQYMLMLLFAAIFLLLIAASNVANLQYARAAEREREVAVRLALGAGRLRLIRQLLTESILLGLLGAGLGLVLAKIGLILIINHMPPEIVRYIAGWKDISLDGRALAFTILVAALAGIVSGLAPALKSAKTDLNQTLKEGGRSSSAGVARQRACGILVVSEISLALILLVGAGLMVKGCRALLDVNRGLSPETLLTMQVELPDTTYKEPRQQSLFYQRTLDALETIPSVQSAAVVTNVPFGDYGLTRNLEVEGLPAPVPGEQRTARVQVISPSFFSTMNIALTEGREFSTTDGPDTMPVTIIGEQLARRYFPEQDPVGKRIKAANGSSPASWLTVVGVARDVKYDWISKNPDPVLYLPYQQSPMSYTYLVVRASDPTRLTPAIRSKLATVDPVQPISEVQTLERVISNAVVGIAYVAVMMAVMGVIALVLSSVGVYGLISYSVAERTHEIGVRMALGAARGDVLKMVVRRGVGLTLAGLAIGLPLSIGLARLLSGLLFGVGATDLQTFAGVSVVLLSVAFLACYVPARRATRVDPMVALRYE